MKGREGSSTPTMRPPFVNIGERTNVTGSARFRRLISDGDYPAALAVARDQVEAGAQVLDVNMDEGLLDSVHAMTTFLNLIAAEPDIARVPVMIDSSEVGGDRGRPQVRPGQGHRQFHQPQGGRGQVPGPGGQVPALWGGGGGHGLRRTGPGRHAGAQGGDLRARLRAADRRIGFPPEDIIFDPNIFAIATGIEEHDNYAVDFIEATRAIKQTCPTRGCPAGSRTSRSASAATSRCGGPCTRCSSTTPSPRAWTWASSTPATCRSMTRSTRSCARRSRT